MSYTPTRKHRPVAVTIMAVVAFVAALLALLDVFRYMGWLPISVSTVLGDIRFVLPQAYWLGAILAGINAFVWFVVAGWLWNLNPSGWLFVVVIAIFNLVLLFLALLGQTTVAAILPGLLINAIALLLAFLPGTREAFGQR